MSMLSAFIGTMGGARIVIQGQTISDDTISPTNASAALRISSDGTYSKITASGGTTSFGAWVLPAGAASSFEYQATILSGSLTSGTVGSWVSGTQTWTLQQTSLGSSACSLQIEIRWAVSGAVVSTKTFDIAASKN